MSISPWEYRYSRPSADLNDNRRTIMPRNGHTAKISEDLWQAFKLERQPGGEFHGYPSDNAAIENLLLYALAFRRPHALKGVSALTLVEQDIIHAYVLDCVVNKIDLRPLLPKPATPEALLALAKKWQRMRG